MSVTKFNHEWINKNAAYYTDIKSNIFDESRRLELDEDKPVVPGVRYQSYEDCITYINSVETPSYYKRWVVRAYGQVDSAVNLRPWVYVYSEGSSAVLTPTIATVAGSTHAEAYRIDNCVVEGYDPVANTSLTAVKCLAASQENTTGGGNLYLYGGKLFSSAGLANGPNMSTLNSFELLEGAQVTVGSFSNVKLWGDCRFSTKAAASGEQLEAYGGGSQIYLGGNLTLSTGFAYLYGTIIWGYGFNVSVNNIYFQAVDVTVYQSNISATGASGVLDLRGCYDGLGTEVFSASAGASVAGVGSRFFPGSSGLTSNETHGAIKELAALIAAQFPSAIESKSAGFTAEANKAYVCTADLTVTLPAPSAGKRVMVKSSGAFTLTIDGDGNNIDGAANYVMTSQYESVTLLSTATEWLIV